MITKPWRTSKPVEKQGRRERSLTSIQLDGHQAASCFMHQFISGASEMQRDSYVQYAYSMDKVAVVSSAAQENTQIRSEAWKDQDGGQYV